MFCSQETFEAGLATFEQEGIKSLTGMKDTLDKDRHPQAKVIRDRHANVIRRYGVSLQGCSANSKSPLSFLCIDGKS